MISPGFELHGPDDYGLIRTVAHEVFEVDGISYNPYKARCYKKPIFQVVDDTIGFSGEHRCVFTGEVDEDWYIRSGKIRQV